MNRLLIVLALFSVSGCMPAEEHDDGIADDAPATAVIDSAHNSRNSVDWPGVYTGVLPCADCEGIQTSVTLHPDGRFERRTLYLGKPGAASNDEGTFAWDDKGGVVTLSAPEAAARMYQVGENRLFHLDINGSRITGDLANRYVLEKLVSDPQIEGRRWVLTELNGQPVNVPDDGEQAYLELTTEELKITGHASCNRFFGRYEIKQGNRISFGENMGITMMACPDMSVETAFMDVLRNVDNYAIAADELSLNKARMAPLARFKASSE